MNSKILRLALPNIISNITVPLLGMVDLAILGRLESEVYLGAVALGSIIFNFIYWGFSFLRMGTSGFTALSYGQKDFDNSRLIFFRSMSIALGGSAILLLFQYPLGSGGFWILEGSPEVEKFALQYFNIRIWAAPATLGLYTFSGWFIGMQNARFPMYITLLVNILNAGLDYAFVFWFGMDVDGVALGTVISQYSGLILSIILFRKYYPRFAEIPGIKVIMNPSELKAFFKSNSDIFIRTILLILTFSFFTSKSASESDLVLAVNTLLLQFLMFFSYFIDGFAHAAEALTGRFKGAADRQGVIRLIRTLFIWGFWISMPFTIVYSTMGHEILRILTSNTDILTAAKPYLIWIGIVPLISFPAYLWDGIYTGATSTAAMRNVMIISTLLVFIPIYYILSPLQGNHALWLAMILFLACRGLFMSLLYKRRVIGN